MPLEIKQNVLKMTRLRERCNVSHLLPNKIIHKRKENKSVKEMFWN